MSQRNRFSKLTSLIGALTRVGALLALALTLMLLALPSEVLFESLESTTTNGGPIFNRVKFIPGRSRDIWMMNQGHQGLGVGPEWDRLAIVVDNDKKMARFYQLAPGSLEWREPVREIGFRVSCFLCHSNGPRAMRPNWNSVALSPSFRDRAAVWLWNMRIKTYGRIQAADHGDEQRLVPFQRKGHSANETLNVAACTRCHNEDSLFARGSLTRQNFMSIRFLVENGHMPPPGFSVSEQEKSEISRFLGAR